MKKILLATVAVIGFAGVASAADLAIRPAPVYAPAFNWSGCYIGGYIGGAWNAENIKALDVNDWYDNTDYLHHWSYDTDSSFIGGGTVGCNWQPVGSPWVFGLEGEIGAIDLNGTGYDPFAYEYYPLWSTVKIGDWYGMITGRLGYAWDRVLVYAKGGAAFLTVDAAVYDPYTAFAATGSKDISTWTIGGGLEYAFNWNWSLKAEYMFIGLDNVNACGAYFNYGSFCWNHELEGIHTAKIGLNYRFGGGAPVVARY
jgi:outer membrane immunogenic protein